MSKNYNAEINAQELNDDVLENIVGGVSSRSKNDVSGFSAGDIVVFKEWKTCLCCRLSIPSATLKFYRGLDPNNDHAWIVENNCCGAIYCCTESGVIRQ